jgi:GNAT superfamily N-acetyltransferase
VRTRLVSGYIPGAIGRVTEMHAQYYSRHWSFGLFFEAKVARELSEFLECFDGRRDGFWTVVDDGRVLGAIAIDGAKAEARGAHLRWFIIDEALQGSGWGGQLLHEAVGFCRKNRYDRVFLWTFAGLAAARHLYEKAGFVLVEQIQGRRWGTTVTEQRFDLQIPQSSRSD